MILFKSFSKSSAGHITDQFGIEHYCCPTNSLLNTCKWRGSLPDCPVANCEKDEVNIVLDEIGDKAIACACKYFPFFSTHLPILFSTLNS